MATVTVSADTKRVRISIEAAGVELARQIDQAVMHVAQEVALEAKGLAPKAHSPLTNAIIASRIGPASHLVRAGTRYAVYVEEGTRLGGYPPLQTLVDWIRVKRIVPHDPAMSTERLAKVMRRSIGAKGTPAQPFMGPALERKLDRIGELIRGAVSAGLGPLA
jgi:hypothetical protein